MLNHVCLTRESLKRVDAVCDEFEEAWKHGQPRLEDYLRLAPDSESSLWFRALLELELELSRNLNNAPGLEEYLVRFPHEESVVRATFEPASRCFLEGETFNAFVGTFAEPVINSRGQPPTLNSSSEPGISVGRYILKGVLGSGAMGTVFLAYDPELDRPVAIKIPSPAIVATPEGKVRFLREARVVAGLHHRHLCPIYDFGQTGDGTLFIAMGYLPGQSLSELIGVDLADEDRVKLILKIAQGISHAHRNQIIHRDLKPSNILLDAEGEPIVTDFGLARRIDSNPSATRDGQILGSPAYMSPEQAVGDQEKMGPASDIYSLGVIFYQILTGQLPFQGDAAAILQKVMITAAPRPSTIRPDINPELELICMQAMAKSPEQRFLSMQEFEVALSDWLSRRSQFEQASIDDGKSNRPTSGRRLSFVIGIVSLLTIIFVLLATRPLRFPATASGSGPGLSEQRQAATVAQINNLQNIEKSSAEVSTILESQFQEWAGWPADAPRPAVVPFTELEARQYQQDWADYLNVPTEYTNSIGMTFCLIPPGEFEMGHTESGIEAAIEPIFFDKNWTDGEISAHQHRVILTSPFYIGKYEVTQQQYQNVMKTNPSAFSPGQDEEFSRQVSGIDTSELPVETVNWGQANQFCAQLTSLESKSDGIHPVYRLPTEAEWEFACLAGRSNSFSKGEPGTVAWRRENSGGRPHPVGQMEPNAFGAYDFYGNVWEWVSDSWSAEEFTRYRDVPAINPKGSAQTTFRHVARGGSWLDPTVKWHIPRNQHPRNHAWANWGFRVALSVETVQEASRPRMVDRVD